MEQPVQWSGITPVGKLCYKLCGVLFNSGVIFACLCSLLPASGGCSGDCHLVICMKQYSCAARALPELHCIDLHMLQCRSHCKRHPTIAVCGPWVCAGQRLLLPVLSRCSSSRIIAGSAHRTCGHAAKGCNSSSSSSHSEYGVCSLLAGYAIFQQSVAIGAGLCCSALPVPSTTQCKCSIVYALHYECPIGITIYKGVWMRDLCVATELGMHRNITRTVKMTMQFYAKHLVRSRPVQHFPALSNVAGICFL